MKTQTTTYYQFYSSPIGKLLLIAQHNTIIGIEFEQEQPLALPTQWQQILPNDKKHPEITVFDKISEILDRYFAGEQVDFRSLPLAPQGTAFQQAVWKILLDIPYGHTTSYGNIAKQLGKPNAMRAVGGAVGRNPISILIPCHRVLSKNQALTGFGGGLPAKRWLLQRENIHYNDAGIEFVNRKLKPWEK